MVDRGSSLDALEDDGGVQAVPAHMLSQLLVRLTVLAAAVSARRAQVEECELGSSRRNDTERKVTYISVREAAERMGFTPDHLYKTRERYPFIKQVGPRSYRVSPLELDRWIANRSR